MGEHLTEDGEFKSDKYAWCPEGFIPLKFTDRKAQDLILEYGLRSEDTELGEDIEVALEAAGFSVDKMNWEEAFGFARRVLQRTLVAVDAIAGWSGASGNWPLQEASGILRLCIDLFKENKERENVPLYIPYTPENRTALEAIRTYCAVQKSCCSDKKLFDAYDSIEERIKFLLDR